MRLIHSGVFAAAMVAACSAQNLPKRIVTDERRLLISPFHARARDLEWLVPFGAVTGLLLATDSHTMTANVHSSAATISRSIAISNASLAGMGAIPAAMYGFGHLYGNTHLNEGALIAGEALATSFLSDEAMKAILRRDRPTVDNAHGSFFGSTSFGSSFPSGHAMLSWSVASAIAHRYPGWLTGTAVYSLAAAASLPRITAEKHFPSDVVVGAVLGWLIGREIFRHRHTEGNPANDAPGNVERPKSEDFTRSSPGSSRKQ